MKIEGGLEQRYKRIHFFRLIVVQVAAEHRSRHTLFVETIDEVLFPGREEGRCGFVDNGSGFDRRHLDGRFRLFKTISFLPQLGQNTASGRKSGKSAMRTSVFNHDLRIPRLRNIAFLNCWISSDLFSPCKQHFGNFLNSIALLFPV
jgi:hypothetical protein